MKKTKLSKYFISNIMKFFLLIIGDIGEAISMVIWSLFMKGLADTWEKGSIVELKKLLLLGIGFLIFYFLISNFRAYCRRSFLRKVNYQLKTDIFSAILSKNINDFNEINSSKYISILNNDVATIENNYFANVPDIIENIITFLVATIALFIYEPIIALATLMLSFIPMLVPLLFGKKVSEKQEKYFNFLETYNTKIKDIFNGFEVIKSFNSDKITEKLYNDVTRNVENSRFHFRTFQNTSIAVQYTLSYATGLIQLILSIYLVLIHKITFGVLLGTMQISNYVTNPAREASMQLLNLKSISGVKLKIEEILNCKKQDKNKEITSNKLITPTPIELIDVNFGYDNISMVLKNISLKFEKNKKYAIVGNSGAGKSTLIKLIMRYYDEYTGRIVLGTQELKKIDKSSLSNYFSMIHQRIILFDDTLRNNITMFHEYPDETIETVIKDAGLDELVKALPNGLDSRVNESGNNFSGGEQQRISIARAFLKNTSVMLLDEATSSLDSELAMQIENLILEKKELTAIVVTHKLVECILKKYDCIITLNHGQVVECGTFDELMNNKQYFYSLFTISK